MRWDACSTQRGSSGGGQYPGYSGQIPKSAAMFAEVLRQGGYSTALIGKNHNIADWETSISGPYDRWPNLQGFDYFYGFIGGEMDQWQPVLYRGTTPVAMDDKWELYNLADDFSEANDVSAKYPQKLKELQNDFWVEAKKYDVLPLDDRFSERGDPSLRPSLIAGRTDFTYYPGATRIPEPSAVNTKNTSHTITATIEAPHGGADGVLVAEGGVGGGFTLYLKEG